MFEILNREHKARRPKRKKQMPTLASVENDLTNLYQHLHLEDLSQEMENDDKGVSTAPVSQPVLQDHAEFELDNQREDDLFAAWCFLKDVSDIRMHVKQVWREYKKGELSFLAAAKVATFAMCVCFELGQQFAECHPEVSDFDKLIDTIGAQHFYTTAANAQVARGCRAQESLQSSASSG